MTRPQSAATAWEDLRHYASQPQMTIKTAAKGSENKIGVDSREAIFFQKNAGDKRKVRQEEFTEIWKTFQAQEEITRKEVGEMTSRRAGAALFGAMNELFDVELDLVASPIRLRL